MNFLFILIFACSVSAYSYLTTETNIIFDIHRAANLIDRSTCISDIEIMDSEKDLLEKYTWKLQDGRPAWGPLRTPSIIWKINTKTGEKKELVIREVSEIKKKMVEQEEKFIKGYELKLK